MFHYIQSRDWLDAEMLVADLSEAGDVDERCLKISKDMNSARDKWRLGNESDLSER